MDKKKITPKNPNQGPKKKAVNPLTGKHPGGRPATYTPELGLKVCEAIAKSDKGLVTICAPDDMPSRTTVHKWINEIPEFANNYARAREDQADFLAEQILEIADDSSNDTITLNKGGESFDVENKEWTNRSKLRVEARKWIASKLKPKKYGDKLELGGELNVKTVTETTQFTLKAKK